jgi:TonB family protein
MTARLEHDVPFGRGYGYGHSCRMHARNLVAETKPLLIHFKPDAHISRIFEGYGNSMWVRVTFGAEGKVLDVQQLQTLMPEAMQQAVERTARQIQFEPEMVNGMPVSVTKEIEIHFMTD